MGLEYIEQTLLSLGPFYYWPNDGNLGDYLIAEATRQFFRRNHLSWKEYCPEDPPNDERYNVVYGGGGRFVPHWAGVDMIQGHLTRPQVQRCVILPHSIRGVDAFVNSLDERHTVFCRDYATLAYCRALNSQSGFVLAHDMGLCLSVDDLPELGAIEPTGEPSDEESRAQYDLLTGSAVHYAWYRMRQATMKDSVTDRTVAFVLRTDKEKNCQVTSSWAYDLSIFYSASCRETAYSARLVRLMAEMLRYPDVVVTDRLHVAIMAMHVGKEVYMLDNDYGKLSGVYEVSLKDRTGVHLLRSHEPWPDELLRVWNALNETGNNRGGGLAQEITGGDLLSVIVPVYNTAPWLRRCLDSICAQNYRNLEILCVNDGSTDNSAEILAEYAAKDERIRVFTQENAGLSAARNTALAHATGEWVTGVDSDDYLEQGVYARAMADITPAVDIIFYGVMEVDESGAPLPFNHYFELPAAGQYEMTPALAEKLNVCFWSKLWRRAVLEEHRLRFPHGLVHEDEAMYYLAAPFVRKIAVCPELGYHYVQRTGSIMNGGGLTPVKRAQRYVPMLEYTAAEYQKRGLLQGSARKYILNMLLRLCAGTYWEPECQGLHARLLRRYRFYKDDYRLERLLPVPSWLRLFVSLYPQSKVYRFFGLAVWCVCYSDAGRAMRSHGMLLDRLMKLFR